MNKYKFIEGKCNEMCPRSEIDLRTRERLLHFFEIDHKSTNYWPIPNKMVKEFKRSAAGVRAPNECELRTKKALLQTVEYLLSELICDPRKPYAFLYEFIFDRLRSVRQEIVMQNFNASITISLLEPVVVFLAYSAYRLCEASMHNFDPKICHQHLQECLQKLLFSYDEPNSTYNIANRVFIESIYVTFNLTSTESLVRVLHLPKVIKESQCVQLSFSIALEYYRGNWYRCLQLIDNLPHVLHGVAALALPQIQRNLLLSLSYGFHNKTLGVPFQWIANIMKCNFDDLSSLCKYYEIQINGDDNIVVFNKIKFNQTKSLMPIRYIESVEHKLKDVHLPDIMLLRFS